MYGGKCVEYGTADQVFRRPEHPYTWGLLGSMPRLDRDVRERLISIKGTPPSLINLPSGCAFHPRCPYSERDGIPCRTEVPELVGDAHKVACHLPAPTRSRLFADDIAPHL
jgi:peptide/nickel transport system ATP-binding protein